MFRCLKWFSIFGYRRQEIVLEKIEENNHEEENQGLLTDDHNKEIGKAISLLENVISRNEEFKQQNIIHEVDLPELRNFSKIEMGMNITKLLFYVFGGLSGCAYLYFSLSNDEANNDFNSVDLSIILGLVGGVPCVSFVGLSAIERMIKLTMIRNAQNKIETAEREDSLLNKIKMSNTAFKIIRSVAQRIGFTPAKSEWTIEDGKAFLAELKKHQSMNNGYRIKRSKLEV